MKNWGIQITLKIFFSSKFLWHVKFLHHPYPSYPQTIPHIMHKTPNSAVIHTKHRIIIRHNDIITRYISSMHTDAMLASTIPLMERYNYAKWAFSALDSRGKQRGPSPSPSLCACLSTMALLAGRSLLMRRALLSGSSKSIEEIRCRWRINALCL